MFTKCHSDFSNRNRLSDGVFISVEFSHKMTEQTKIVIADDHPIFRAGLRQVVESDRAFTVVGEASDGAAALEMISDLKPDIVITDINMPGLNGFEIAGEMRRRGLPGEIVLLTIHDEEAMFVRAMSLGVRGYVVKEGATADIVNCLHAVRRGQSFTSAAMTGYLFNRAAETRDRLKDSAR